jgi:hypothetical protein
MPSSTVAARACVSGSALVALKNSTGVRPDAQGDDGCPEAGVQHPAAEGVLAARAAATEDRRAGEAALR